MYYQEEVNLPDATVDSLELITRHGQLHHLFITDGNGNGTTNPTEITMEQRKRSKTNSRVAMTTKVVTFADKVDRSRT